MAFCKECGAEITGGKFCHSCGAPVEGGVQVGYSKYVDPRKETLDEFEKMLNYFGVKGNQYEEAYKLQEEIDLIANKNYELLAAFGALFLLVMLFVAAGTGKLSWLLIGVAALVLGVLYSNNNKKKARVILKEKKDRFNIVKQELVDHYQAYGYCKLGFEYTDPQALKTLYDYVRSGRANSFSDALNLLDQDSYNRNMLALQQEATAAAQQTAKSARTTAFSTTASFIFGRRR